MWVVVYNGPLEGTVPISRLLSEALEGRSAEGVEVIVCTG